MMTELKVLIIEDRRENIVFLANNALKPKGFDIITAMDGETGLRKALTENPDLIITDLNLPKMGGLDILAELQARGSPIPTIVMTFQGSEDIARRAFRLGARDYLIKPFTVDEFDAALERAMQSAQAGASTAGDEALRQEIAALTTEVDRLTSALAEQVRLTTDARQRAKSMMVFIQRQQHQILRQRQTLQSLRNQTKSLFEAFNKLVTEVDAQLAQYHRPPQNEA